MIIALKFPQYDGPFLLLVTCGGGDEFILFELGTPDGDSFAVVQNYSQVNFAVTALPKKVPDKPARRVDFISSD